MYNNGNSSKNVTGSSIVDGTVETVDIADDAVTADKLANSVNTDIGTGVTASTTAGNALPKAGGAMTGAITTNSTFDGVDVAARDGVLTTTTATANDALPKAGGTMTGTIAGFTSTGIDDNSNALAMTIDSSERVGVGTATPAYRLDTHTLGHNSTGELLVTAGNNANDDYTQAILLRLRATSINANQPSHTANSAVGEIRFLHHNLPGSASAGSITFSTNPSNNINGSLAERMRIDSSGNVLIGKTTLGTTTVGTQILPTGITQATADGASALYLYRLTSDGAVVNFRKNATAVGSISVTTSTTAYNTSSDYRLKENVIPMSGSIDRLKALKPSNFNFISEPLKVVDGFLAHEAQEVVPEAVHGTKDAMVDEEYEVTPAVMDGETVVTEAVMGTRSVPDYQGIDQSKLVPLLVASLQEAVDKIELLEARLTAGGL